MTQQLTIKIKKKYFNKVPRPTPQQYEALKESIENEGQHDPIILNKKGEIIDGYTRYQICQELGIEPKITIREFADKTQESNYVITANLKRRHLTDFQIYELFESQIEEIKQQNLIKRNQDVWKARKDAKPKNTPRTKYENSTQYKVYKLTGLSAGVYENIVFVKANADKKLIEKIRKKEITVNKAADQLRARLKLRSDKGTHYRSRFGVVYDILSAIQTYGESSSTKIAHRARLSTRTTYSILRILTSGEFVKYENDMKTKHYTMTEKGTKFFYSIKELENQLPKELTQNQRDDR